MLLYLMASYSTQRLLECKDMEKKNHQDSKGTDNWTGMRKRENLWNQWDVVEQHWQTLTKEYICWNDMVAEIVSDRIAKEN